MSDHTHQSSMFGGAELAEDYNPKALARRHDPATSKEAAARVADFAGDHHSMILGAMRAMGKPVGAEQIAAALLRGGVKLDAYQIRKRTIEMQRRGLIDATDHTRETSSGRHERLWRLVA